MLRWRRTPDRMFGMWVQANKPKALRVGVAGYDLGSIPRMRPLDLVIVPPELPGVIVMREA